MIPIPTYPFNLPTYGTTSSKVAPAGGLYDTGYVPGDELPAEHLNFFFGDLTANANSVQANQINIATEIINVLTRGGITPTTTPTTQLDSALQATYLSLVGGTMTGALAMGSQIITGTGQFSFTASSSSTVTGAVTTQNNIYSLTTGASLQTLNLPAATGSGKLICATKVDNGVGSVKIHPNSTNNIGQAGNVDTYLNAQYQSIVLLDSASGNWVVLSGQITPDNNGDYSLGKLHHLPLGNTTSRRVFNGPPPSNGTFSSAINVTSAGVGIPVGAKAIKAKILTVLSSSASGTLELYFSDNNSNVPSDLTAHPGSGGQITISGGAQTVGLSLIQEITFPLNSSGQFFVYNPGSANVSTIEVMATGYYMGD